MPERPIIFNAADVRANRAGLKWQFRRLVKPQRGFPQHNILKRGMPYAADPWAVWWHGEQTDRVGVLQDCPYGKPGDVLWSKEAWRTSIGVDAKKGSELEIPGGGYNWPIWYESDSGTVTWRGSTDDGGPSFINPGRYRYASFMPRWASRDQYVITEVCCQRLQEITEKDAMAEGVQLWPGEPAQPLTSGERAGDLPYRSGYALLWDELHPEGPTWKDNPFVWAVTYDNPARKVSNA